MTPTIVEPIYQDPPGTNDVNGTVYNRVFDIVFHRRQVRSYSRNDTRQILTTEMRGFERIVKYVTESWKGFR